MGEKVKEPIAIGASVTGMARAPVIEADKAAHWTLRALDKLFGVDGGMPVGVRLWDGTCWPDEAPRPVTLVLKHPGALRTAFLPGTELALAEAYLYDDLDILGDTESVFGLADALAAATSNWLEKLRVARILRRLPPIRNDRHSQRGPARMTGKRHSIERDRQAVTYHYDVSNDFYALWLDRSMTYSCAYFHSPEDDLDTAQERKLDYICRKLRLRAGQRLLDVGCGWGGLVMHAARHYGVDATGVTLSSLQAKLANDRIAAAGLAGHSRVVVSDYREVAPCGTEGYDALVSVGMFEHVGAPELSTYFTQAWRLLRPGGALLNHGIARRASEQPAHGPSFTDTYVFPDGELTPIHVALGAAEKAGFEVRDIESLREHYALTLRHWVRRLESRHDEALRHVDEPTYRVWRLFMSGSAHGFTTGRLNVYQTLMVKLGARGHSGLPLTRADWYAPPQVC
jgi:cyclopropane-fatty-acyl-phospholipid synthase